MNQVHEDTLGSENLEDDSADALAEQLLASLAAHSLAPDSAEPESVALPNTSSAGARENKHIVPVPAELERGGPKKRNRRKEKLVQREQERARIIAEAAKEPAGTQMRDEEAAAISALIAGEGLVEHEVRADGHCLFSSLCDQLQEKHGKIITPHELRVAVARYIKLHADKFAPYLLADEQAEGLSVEDYAEKLVHECLWGGELEIFAVSELYQVPIFVYTSAPRPLRVNDSRFNGFALQISYYRFKYGLGAHYNSLRKPG